MVELLQSIYILHNLVLVVFASLLFFFYIHFFVCYICMDSSNLLDLFSRADVQYQWPPGPSAIFLNK